MEECSGCVAGFDCVGYGNRLGGWGGGVFCVAAGAEEYDAVADFVVVEVSGAGGDDCTFGFSAEDFGFGGLVEAGSEISGRGVCVSWRGCVGAWWMLWNSRVDVIDSYEIVLDEDFAFFRLWNGDIGSVI